MKRYLSIVALLIGFNVSAHDFYPVSSYTIDRDPGVNTQTDFELRSDEDAYYRLYLEGIPLGDAEVVLEGDTRSYTVNIPNEFIKNEHVKVCALKTQSKRQFQQEVCINLKVEG